MADNIYLLETRLSPAQQAALEAVRMVARQQSLTVFLVGGAVRDLMSGSPVRDLDVAVQGDALKLQEQLEEAGAIFSGKSLPQRSLYIRFQTGVRVEVGSTLSASYPKPGKPVYQATTILDDLRRRDFTANAMALSLNEGSYGLLMDPLNGVADIENRELRLVSNYGFFEDPSRLIRAARFMARLGWQMDERTRARYDAAKEENYIAALQPSDRGYEVEELFHEEEPLRVMRRLEEEGWLKHLSPVLSVAKVNAPELSRLREAQMRLESRGIRADASAANFPLLTGKIPAKELDDLKKSFPRTAFTAEINNLESAAKELGTQLLSKAMSLPSEAYKLILRSDPVAVLWALHSSKSVALQARFESFSTEWPQAQQKIPVLLMAEMRITPELPNYEELQETLFYALMDGRLTTPEEMKAFLETYSPPAPPPPVSLRRPRAPRKEAKTPKSRKKSSGLEGEADNPAEPAPPPLGQPVVAISSQVASTPDKRTLKSEIAAEPEPPAPVPLKRKGFVEKASGEDRPNAKAVQAPKAVVRDAAKRKSPMEASGKSARTNVVPKSPKPKAKVVVKAATVKSKTPPASVKKIVTTKPLKKVSAKQVVRRKTSVKKVSSPRPTAKKVGKRTVTAKKSVAKKGSAKRR